MTWKAFNPADPPEPGPLYWVQTIDNKFGVAKRVVNTPGHSWADANGWLDTVAFYQEVIPATAPAPEELPPHVRPELRWFAQHMETVLQAYAGPGQLPDYSDHYLMALIRTKFGHLNEALIIDSPEHIVIEAAQLACTALRIAENARRKAKPVYNTLIIRLEEKP